MPAKRKVAKRKTKAIVQTAPALPVSEGFVSSVKDDVEVSVPVSNEVTDSNPGDELTARCIDSASVEKSTDADIESSVPNVARPPETENMLKTNDSKDVDSQLATDSEPLEPQPVACNPSESESATDVLPSGDSLQPNPPEAPKIKMKQKLGSKKRAQKQSGEVNDMSTDVTWEVSSRENSRENVVLIRRQHHTGMSNANQEFVECPVEKTVTTAASKSPVSHESNCNVEERDLSNKPDVDNMEQEQSASVTKEPGESTMSTATMETLCTQNDVPGNTSAKNVDFVVSTESGDVITGQSIVARPKRQRKALHKTEACRKSQRCRSRRQSTEECVGKLPASTSGPEVKTLGSSQDAQKTYEETLPYSVCTKVSQEQAMSAHNSPIVDETTAPATAVCSAPLPIEPDIRSSGPTLVTCSSVGTVPSDDVLEPIKLDKNTELVPETMLKSQLTGFVDRLDIVYTQDGQSLTNSSSDVKVSSCHNLQPAGPIVINQEMKTVSPIIDTQNEAVKRESGSTETYHSYVAAADANVSNRQSDDASLLNTCLSETILATAVSPREHFQPDSVVRPCTVDGTGQKQHNAGQNEISGSVGAVASEENEPEGVCKLILDEVVAHIVQETCMTSTAKENVDSSSEPSGCRAGCSTAQNESDSTLGEIPLKKRRRRSVFTDRQQNDTIAAPCHSDNTRRTAFARSSDHRQKISSSTSRRHLPRGSKYVGAHTSVVGNVACAVHAAAKLGSRAFGMFIKCQNQLQSEPLSSDEVSAFKKALTKYGYTPHMVLPHGSYLLNCGSSDPRILQDSRESLVDDLQRCQVLGLPLFNFHPGSYSGQSGVDDCIERIAESINQAHSRVDKVITVLENMAGEAGTIGGSFLELRRIINRIKDKSRIGICLDTCHAFAAGYDIRTESGYDEMMHDLEQFIGLEYLKAVHINDSRDDVGSHVDHHTSIGRGRIGLDCFRRIMNDRRFENLPLILETPSDCHLADIDLLYSFVV